MPTVLVALDVPTQYVEKERSRAELSDSIALADLLMRHIVTITGTEVQSATPFTDEQGDEPCNLRADIEELTARVDGLAQQVARLDARTANIMRMAEPCRGVDHKGDHK